MFLDKFFLNTASQCGPSPKTSCPQQPCKDGRLPCMSGELTEEQHRRAGSVKGAQCAPRSSREPGAYVVSHRAKIRKKSWSTGCQQSRYWLGYLELQSGEGRRASAKRVDEEFMHDSVFMVNRSFGIDSNCAKKWRLRLYFRRSSYTGEGNILKALQPSTLPAELDAMLFEWVGSVAGVAKSVRSRRPAVDALPDVGAVR